MEPAIPTGSLVYIKEMEPKDVQVDDVIAFYGTKDAASIITHRVVERSSDSAWNCLCDKLEAGKR